MGSFLCQQGHDKGYTCCDNCDGAVGGRGSSDGWTVAGLLDKHLETEVISVMICTESELQLFLRRE
jgi:hypothetical protein